MTRYEYRVIPAPLRGLKAKGAKTTEARFALALMEVINAQGREGWEYQRADTLPCEERVGLTGRATRFQNMLIFRRELAIAETEMAEPVAFMRAEAHEAEVEDVIDPELTEDEEEPVTDTPPDQVTAPKRVRVRSKAAAREDDPGLAAE